MGMMDFYLNLLREDRGHRVVPEVLTEWADLAATRHVEEGMDLTSAALSVVRGKKLNPAHVARVVEGTNTQAYLKLYDRCPGPNRHVHFEGGPARIFEILGAVFDVPSLMSIGSDKIGSRRNEMPSLDYFVAPTRQMPVVKQAQLTEEDVFLERMPLQKVAEMLAQGSKSPGGRAHLYQLVKEAANKATADVASLTYRLEQGAMALLKSAEQAVKEGASPADVARVMLGDQPGQSTLDVVDMVLHKMGARVDPDTIPWGRQVTPNHPLGVKTAELAGCAECLVERTQTRQELQLRFNEIASTFQER